jgi:hypothetical protein
MTDPAVTPDSTDPAATGQVPDAPQTVDSLPEWARTKLTEANREAAKYRTEKNDAVAAAKVALSAEYDAKLTEAADKYTELEYKLSARELDLLKLETALGLDIPSTKAKKFAALLTGTTEDEIKASAAEAKELFGGLNTPDRPTDPSQGSANTLPLNGDPLLAMVRKVVGA